MKKIIVRILLLFCAWGVFLAQLVHGQERLPMRKGSMPIGTAEELQKIQNNASIQIVGDLSEKQILQNSQMQRELQKIVSLLLIIFPKEFSWTSYQVTVINDINFGARAYQNGTIVVDQNFVCRQSDELVVYALGHEITHIGRQEGLLENIFKDNLRNELANFLISNPTPGEVTRRVQDNTSRIEDFYFQQEVLADIWGVKSMVAAGFRIKDSKELLEFYIDTPFYPKKQDRAKLVLDEQSSFLSQCNFCRKTPGLNLSKLRLSCYGSRR